MADINRIRTAVSSKYDGPNWKKKVSQMSDAQVIAIWYSMQSRPKESEKESKEQEVQLPLFDNL